MEKTLLKKIKAGQMVYGTCIASTSPTWPAIAQRAGLDFVFLDTEHIPLERMEIARMCQTFRLWELLLLFEFHPRILIGPVR